MRISDWSSDVCSSDLAQAALFGADAAAFARDPALGDEVFGSSSIVVRASDPAEIARLVGGLEGQLTATLLFDEADEELVAPLIPLLARKAGRILANGWPTGVEVCHAMVHGDRKSTRLNSSH